MENPLPRHHVLRVPLVVPTGTSTVFLRGD
jgi:hypothetical protein